MQNDFFNIRLGARFNDSSSSLAGEREKLAGIAGKDGDASRDIEALDYNKRFVSLNRETMLEFFQKKTRQHKIAGVCVDYFLQHGRIPSKNEMDDFALRTRQEEQKRAREAKLAKLDPRLPAPCYS